jgi:DNA-binding transcriptional MerR regulator
MDTSLMRRPGSRAEQTHLMPIRLSIGDFSKMTYLSVKSLRRYHDMGLLVPAEVDDSTGYRYYEAAQVPVGQVIRRFRDLGMPLERIKGVLRAPDAAARGDLIVAHLREMESALAQTQQTVASLRALLERPPDPISVAYLSVAAASVLAISEPVTMDGIDSWWSEAFDELHRVLETAGAQRAGPDGALYSSEFFEDELGEVMAFIPLAGRLDPAGRARLTEIPAAELAVTVHQGAFSGLDRAYGALGTFVSAREIGVRGPIREHYLVTFTHTQDESLHRTEVCWPVFHTRGEST